MTKRNDNSSIREVYTLISEMRTEFTGSILRLENKIDNIEVNHLMHIKTDLEKLKAESAPVKSLVYGLVGIIMTAVIGALLYLVLK